MSEFEANGAASVRSDQRTLTPRRLKVDGMVFLLSLAALALCAMPIDSNVVKGPEVGLFEAINGLPAGIYPAVYVVMQLGNIVAVPVTAVVAAAFGRYKLAIGILASGTFAWLLAKTVKDLVPRGRPGELLEDFVLHGDTPLTGRGFVSGHAAVVAAIATVLTPYLGTKGRWALWTLAALTCLARVYVGAHLPLDVVGGAALGIAGGTLALLVLDLVPARPRGAGSSPL